MFRFIIVAVALLFSSVSFSADYYWAIPDGQYAASTPKLSCDTYIGAYANLRFSSLVKVSDSSWSCSFYNYKYPSNISSGLIIRIGSQCPTGKTFIPATGECRGDICKEKEGTSKRFEKSGTFPDPYVSVTKPTTPGGKIFIGFQQSGCFDSCLANTVDQKCLPSTKGGGTGSYYCRGTAYFTGAGCGTTPAPEVDETADASPPQPETTESKEPCVYTASADGSQTCISKTLTDKQGQNCGTVNGVQTCLDSLPSKNGIDIKTEVTEKMLADGSKQITKKDTATVTKCSGFEICKTGVTTITTKTVKNGSGTTTSTTGTCSGASCPDANGNPDGDGDGFGDCVGGDCGEGEGEGGEGAGIAGPELEEVPGYGDSLNAFMDSLNEAPIVSAVSAIRVPTGGSMPGGSAAMPWGSFDFSSTASLAPELLNPLRYVFLALWAFAAIRLLFTA